MKLIIIHLKNKPVELFPIFFISLRFLCKLDEQVLIENLFLTKKCDFSGW